MPLVGIVDPSHDEYSKDQPLRYPKWMPVDDVLERALFADPKWSPWTYELLKAATSLHEDRDYLSSSKLVSACPRSEVIALREPYVATIDGMYAAFRGTMVHRTMEYAARDGSMAEWRFWTTLRDEVISCSPDLLTHDTVWDYKLTENPPTFGYPWRKHTLQVQFNRLIVNHAEEWVDNEGNKQAPVPFDPRNTVFEHAVLVYLGPKGPKPIEVTRSQEVRTPNNKTVKRKMPYVWSDEEVLAEMLPRAENMRLALDSYPVWPTGLEEEWGGQADWRCPGPPLCYLPACLAKRWPAGLVWESPA